MNRYNSNTAFLDLIFNVTLFFFVCFVIAFLNIRIEESKKADIEKKAEFVAITNWDKKSSSDIDTYMRNPVGDVCFFRSVDIGLMYLDRDDRGEHGDILQAMGIEKKYEINREIMTIRGIIPGEYILNVHSYFSGEPTEVSVELFKVNPEMKSVKSKTVTLNNAGDEETICRFVVNKDGQVLEVNDLPASLSTVERMNNDN